MTFSFTTRDMETVTGEEARRLLAENNDQSFHVPGRGVVSVSRERWMKAQDAEAHGWMDIWRDVPDDRNMHHFTLFDYLFMLKERRFKHAIELGCGPFTNMRLVAHSLAIESIHLLDPLMPRYVDHPHCTYRSGQLRLHDGRMVPIDAAYAMPIEDLRPEVSYDLVVLINVIEHCMDAEKAFSQVWNMLSPGGVLIFHDKYFDEAEVAATILTSYDTAHPIKVGHAVIDNFLSRFRLIFSRSTSTHGKPMMTATGDAIYFVGEKP
jgi:SAM-dependent methyltransferase